LLFIGVILSEFTTVTKCKKKRKNKKINSYLGKKIPLESASRRLLIRAGGAKKDWYASRELASIFSR